MLFLLTTETTESKFIETLIDTTKIVTIRLAHSSDYVLAVEDVNESTYTARFKTEEALRARLRELLTVMNADTSIADTMKVAVRKTDRSEISDKLADLIRSL